MFVVTETPVNGYLLFIQDGKSSVNLYQGYEFYLHDFYNRTLQYRFHGDRNRMRDSFEILATDGNVELTNKFSLELKSIKNDFKRDKSSPNNIFSAVKFAIESDILSVFENTTIIRVPIHRIGDVSQKGHVRCYTSVDLNNYPPATPSEDFEPRIKNANSSLLVFSPREKSINCEVSVLNDITFEMEEEFSLNLEIVPGNAISAIHDKPQLKIRISDPEDKPRIQFDKKYVAVLDELINTTKHISINVLRTGDSSTECHARVHTQDGTAIKGVDYEELSAPLVFRPGVTSHTINVKIFLGRTHVRHRRLERSFYVFINPQDVLGADLGTSSLVTVAITPPSNEERKLKIFPTKPVVFSLRHYFNSSNITSEEFSPGYPLVCVSSCNEHHPLFNTTKELCRLTGINESYSYFSWEIAPYKRTSLFSHGSFQELVESTIFADVHSKILDPSFFGEGYKVRCEVTPISEENGQELSGFPVKSNAILVGGVNATMCTLPSKIPLISEYTENDPVFLTSMKYMNKTNEDPNIKNKINIRIEIPHYDGMVPLISTKPLTNIHTLLTSSHHNGQHICSNLPPNGTFLNYISENNVNGTVWSHLERNATKLLYRHLNYTSCKWTFQGLFYLSELIESCGGKISTHHQDTRNDHSWVSVQVPLHIALHHADGPAEFHQTRLLVSFSYSPTLGHSLEQEYRHSEADIQVTRVHVDEQGRLVLEFRTEAHFPGGFVLHHHALPEARAQLLPPASVPTPFELHAASHGHDRTARATRQHWRARSVFSLQDYSGLYTVVLVPCWLPGGHGACEPRAPVRLPLRVRYRRGDPPAPLHFALDTRLLLARTPPPAPSELQDYSGVFAPGDSVYGRVLWLPEQQLHSAYELRIRLVLLCATPRGTPPPARCTPPAMPRYLLLLLDKENQDHIDGSFNEVYFNASFASNSPSLKHFNSYTNVDGFTFKVAPLYAPGAEQLQWFLQVVYSINPSSTRRVHRRATTPISNTQNITTIRSLHLQLAEKSANITEQVLILALGPALVLLFIPILVTIAFMRFQRLHTQSLN